MYFDRRKQEQKQRVEEQKQKVRDDRSGLRQGRLDFQKQLHVLRDERMKALAAGDRERAKELKEQIERLGQESRDRQHGRWREARKDQAALTGEKKRLEQITEEEKQWRRRR